MSDVILHQFGAISGHLDDLQRGIQGAQEYKEASDKAFSLLNGSGAFLGEAAARLDALRLQHSQKTEEHIANLQQLHGQAVQQQIDTAALDSRLAGGF